MDKKRMSVVFSIFSVLLAFTAYGAPQTVKLKGAIKFFVRGPFRKNRRYRGWYGKPNHRCQRPHSHQRRFERRGRVHENRQRYTR